jgi:hypothetical protein
VHNIKERVRHEVKLIASRAGTSELHKIFLSRADEEDKIINLESDQFGDVSIHSGILEAPKSINGSVEDAVQLFVPEVQHMLMTLNP